MVKFLAPNERDVEKIVRTVRLLQGMEPEEKTAAQIADSSDPINTTNKVQGREVWDTTNKRKLRASGSGATDEWAVVDGSAQVTPS